MAQRDRFSAWDRLASRSTGGLDPQLLGALMGREQQSGLAAILGQQLQNRGGEQGQELAQFSGSAPGAFNQATQALGGAGQMVDREAMRGATAEDLFGLGMQGAGAVRQNSDSAKRASIARILATGNAGRSNQIAQSKEDLRLRQADLYGENWPITSLDAYRKENKAVYDTFNLNETAREKLKTFNADQGIGVVEMINLYQRFVDPGATVRGEDVKLLQQYGLSTGANWVSDFKRLLIDNPAEGKELANKLKARVEQLLDASDDAMILVDDDVRNTITKSGGTERAISRAIPRSGAADRARTRRDTRMKAAEDASKIVYEERVNPATGKRQRRPVGTTDDVPGVDPSFPGLNELRRAAGVQ